MKSHAMTPMVSQPGIVVGSVGCAQLRVPASRLVSGTNNKLALTAIVCILFSRSEMGDAKGGSKMSAVLLGVHLAAVTAHKRPDQRQITSVVLVLSIDRFRDVS